MQRDADCRAGSRLEGVPDSGSAISYENGGVQVSYDELPGLKGSRVSDRVRLCLVSIPEDCPPGDDRGRAYRAKNLRTGKKLGSVGTRSTCAAARRPLHRLRWIGSIKSTSGIDGRCRRAILRVIGISVTAEFLYW